MKKIIVLLIAMLLIGLNSATADETKNWETTLNEFISTMTKFACIEKRSSELKECSIPTEKCKRFSTLVAKNCLGQAIMSNSPIKHPRDMTQEELLTIIDKAATCTGKTTPVITYYVCPEQHERSWAGSGGYKWQDRSKH